MPFNIDSPSIANSKGIVYPQPYQWLQFPTPVETNSSLFFIRYIGMKPSNYLNSHLYVRYVIDNIIACAEWIRLYPKDTLEYVILPFPRELLYLRLEADYDVPVHIQVYKTTFKNKTNAYGAALPPEIDYNYGVELIEYLFDSPVLDIEQAFNSLTGEIREIVDINGNGQLDTVYQETFSTNNINYHIPYILG